MNLSRDAEYILRARVNIFHRGADVRVAREQLQRLHVLRIATGLGQKRVAQSVEPSIGVELPVSVFMACCCAAIVLRLRG
ncbi:MAG TPA: hypothetical protein VF123_15805 [Candidatus Sulfotelmatobacter sp.]